MALLFFTSFHETACFPLGLEQLGNKNGKYYQVQNTMTMLGDIETSKTIFFFKKKNALYYSHFHFQKDILFVFGPFILYS